MSFSKLPNGFGSVWKQKKNLRRPWRARKVIGTVFDEGTGKAKYVFANIGNFATRKEALEALTRSGSTINANGSPATFEEVFNMWYSDKVKEITPDSARHHVRAFGRFEPIHKRPFRMLTAFDYENVIPEDMPIGTRKCCKILLNQLYDYALRHELCEKNYAALTRLGENEKVEHREKRPFTPEEVESLWKHRGEKAADMILVGIYTGFRPSELLQLDITKIDNGCFVGGMKTENGKNRRVPIHPSILPIVEEYRLKSAKLGVPWLFPNDHGGLYISGNFRNAMFPKFAFGHTPHEMRHSFATYARRSGLDPVIIKRLLGHSLNDVTEEVYTHIDDDILKREMEKFTIA